VIALWILTLIGTVLGVISLIEGLSSATGAPQQAASAGIAVACAVIPYCFARAMQQIMEPSREKLLEEARAQTKLLAALANDSAEQSTKKA
jgi:hypothetical protein